MVIDTPTRVGLELLAIELWKQEWGFRERNSGTELLWRDVSRERKAEFRQQALQLIKEWS